MVGCSQPHIKSKAEQNSNRSTFVFLAIVVAVVVRVWTATRSQISSGANHPGLGIENKTMSTAGEFSELSPQMLPCPPLPSLSSILNVTQETL